MVNPAVSANLPYDAVNDFAYITLIDRLPNVLVASAKLPVKNFAEFVRYAKANPGKLNYASSGNGSVAHLSMKLYYSDTLNPRKACAVARHLKLPVEFIHVTLEKGEHRTPEFRAMNPNAKVPVLVDGELVLWESNAIMADYRRTQFGGWSFADDAPVHGREPARFARHPGGREEKPAGG